MNLGEPLSGVSDVSQGVNRSHDSLCVMKRPIHIEVNYNLGLLRLLPQNFVISEKILLLCLSPIHQNLGHSHAGMAIAVESLNSQDLEVVVARRETVLVPVVEVVAGRDGARRALALADREELLESAGASDRWLVVAGTRADVICTAIG